MNRKLFTAWMGPGEMSEARAKAHGSIAYHCSAPLVTITKDNLFDWVDPDVPLHPAFTYLSAVHQCDYLRCYVLHVHGGGYTDIKRTVKNWNRFFDRVESSTGYFGAGYTEIGEAGVARVGGELELAMRQNYTKLVGMCALILKRDTEFSREWLHRVNEFLDSKEAALCEYPARHPQDHNGARFVDGSRSNYPIAWTGLGGDLLHPLIFQHHERFLHLDMAPSFSDYR